MELIKSKILLFFLLLIFFQISLYAQNAVVLDAATKELDRTMSELKNKPNPPYYLSFTIYDINSILIKSSDGKIETNNENKTRTLDIDIRVGNYKFDNTHVIRGEAFNLGSNRNSYILPLDNNEPAIRNSIWFATDKEYKKAIETYEKAKTNYSVKVQEEDTSADFTPEKPHKFFENVINFNIDKIKWIERLRKLSAILTSEKWIMDGNATLDISSKTEYFTNSEGSQIQQSFLMARIYLIAKTKAEDGMDLPLYKTYFAYSPDSLPDEKQMEDDAYKLVNTLNELRNAPVMTTYTGPAILSGGAAGVFFHEIFGHRVEGTRLKDPDNSQTFKNFVNKKILPDFLSVVFDPTIKYLDGRPVSGYYKYDDEGVPGQKVNCVEDGIFKYFLMSRSPVEGFPHSNGHGRKQAGYNAVSRQSNLIVEASKTVSIEKLKDLLREECRKQGLDYGLLFEKVQGGFTFTNRTIPNSFNVDPLIVYKVFTDNKPDEIVRGVDLIGTPLTTFSNIIAAGNDTEIFNGICGAESGSVPVSASSPSLLVSKIEVQKKAKSQAKPPILAAP